MALCTGISAEAENHRLKLVPLIWWVGIDCAKVRRRRGRGAIGAGSSGLLRLPSPCNESGVCGGDGLFYYFGFGIVGPHPTLRDERRSPLSPSRSPGVMRRAT